ncbi:type III pantothenate kinase [Bordetella trematum]|uniref:type III pantothenate kinase n=1 Tax=Bordetella trematum TaxID=123899 RepID=UPI001558A873|nr:type III pantothenate kinase [Bordetella trematum]
MILLIDSGNSRLKVGWLDPLSGHREAQAEAFDNLDLQALARWLPTLAVKPVRALGVNVAGQARGQDIAAILAASGCPMHWVQPQRDALGMTCAYRDPAQLGADRWAAMLGLKTRLSQGHGPALLASFGTATTLDTLGPDDCFIGGLILPGAALMRASLARGTANLPLAEGLLADFPTGTHEAITSGVAAAQAGALARQWLAGRERYGQPPALYVCGGGWHEVRAEVEQLLPRLADGGRAAPLPQALHSPVLDGLAALATGGLA